MRRRMNFVSRRGNRRKRGEDNGHTPRSDKGEPRNKEKTVKTASVTKTTGIITPKKTLPERRQFSIPSSRSNILAATETSSKGRPEQVQGGRSSPTPLPRQKKSGEGKKNPRGKINPVSALLSNEGQQGHPRPREKKKRRGERLVSA